MSKKKAARRALNLIGSRYESLGVARGRLVFVSIVFVVCFMVVGIRVTDLMILQGELSRDHLALKAELGDLNAEKERKSKLVRANIIDRQGALIATSMRVASLYADPKLIEDKERVAHELSKILTDQSHADILKTITRDNRFVWLDRHITPEQQSAVLEIGSPGLGFQYEYKRFYPQTALAGHFVGYVDVDGKGLAGIERSQNEFLQSNDKELQLTLDMRVQHIVHRVVSDAVEKFSALGGAAIVMDVRNGDVLAAVSLPDYDPHDPTAGYSEDGSKILFNRLTQGVYELGSTFKIFSTAALLELSDVSFSDTFDAREPIKIGRFEISDYHAEERILTLPEVFMVSSNIGSALMAQQVGTEKFKQFYADLGLLSRINFDIKEVGAPLIPNPWREISTLTASYGHGIAVTPLQLVAAASSIVNGGFLVKPRLLKTSKPAQGNVNADEDSDRDHLISLSDKSEYRHDIRIVSPQTSHKMRQLMRLVVTHGTGGNADVKGFQVGGKTGTADKAKEDGPGYDRSKRISSFLGFFPMDDPHYAVFVMVDEPKGTKETFGYATGGWVAAPAVHDIIQVIAPMLGVLPRGDVVTDDLTQELRKYISTEDENN